MATRKQIRANRRNAKKSTGPRTPEGKAIASRNATKHGLYATDAVIDTPKLKEDKEEYQRLVCDLTDELRPADTEQSRLVVEIATCLWLQRRAVNAESRYLAQRLTPAAASPVPTGRFMRALARSDTTLSRRLTRATKRLHHLQHRWAEPVSGSAVARDTHPPTPQKDHFEPILPHQRAACRSGLAVVARPTNPTPIVRGN